MKQKRLVIINRPFLTSATMSTIDLARHSFMDNVETDLVVFYGGKKFNSRDERFLDFKRRIGINNNYILINIGSDKLKGKHTLEEIVDLVELPNKISEYTECHYYGGLLTSISRYDKPITMSQSFNMNLGITFASVIKFAFAIKVHRTNNIKIISFTDDPQEFQLSQLSNDISDVNYFGYTYPNHDLTFNDHFQRSIVNAPTMKCDVSDKPINCVIGYTRTNTMRINSDTHVNDIMLTMKHDTNKVFVRSPDEQTFIPRSLYLSQIAKAKYTGIIPPYDDKSFSIFKFIESVALDCLPIIHEHCVIKDVEESYDIELGQLLRNNVDEKDEDFRLRQLELLKSKFFIRK